MASAHPTPAQSGSVSRRQYGYLIAGGVAIGLSAYTVYYIRRKNLKLKPAQPPLAQLQLSPLPPDDGPATANRKGTTSSNTPPSPSSSPQYEASEKDDSGLKSTQKGTSSNGQRGHSAPAAPTTPGQVLPKAPEAPAAPTTPDQVLPSKAEPPAAGTTPDQVPSKPEDPAALVTPDQVPLGAPEALVAPTTPDQVPGTTGTGFAVPHARAQQLSTAPSETPCAPEVISKEVACCSQPTSIQLTVHVESTAAGDLFAKVDACESLWEMGEFLQAAAAAATKPSLSRRRRSWR